MVTRKEASEIALKMMGGEKQESEEEPKKEITQDEIIEAQEVLKIMYHEIIRVLKEYLVMNEEQYKLIAIWLLGTYSHEYFNTYPFLFFNAMRGSGKTRALKLLSALGKGGDGSVLNNLTEAVLFRIPRGQTTCIDEVEQIGNKEKQALRELLNAAYKKGMKVKRMKKVKTAGQELQVAEEFEPYFPIAMANISGMGEVLADRAVTLILEKSDVSHITKKAEDFDKNTRIRWIKLTLEQLSGVVALLEQKKYIEKWNFWLNSTYKCYISTYTTNTTNAINTTKTLYPKLSKYYEMTKNEELVIDNGEEEFFKRLDKSGITGRNFELFMPLLVLSRFLGDDVYEEIFKVVENQVHQKREDEYSESIDVSMYSFVASKEHSGNEFLTIKELTREFRAYAGEEDNLEDKWLNEKWFSRALKRLNLILDKRRVSGCSEVRLNYQKAIDKMRLFRPSGVL